ncbi:MAG TPA: hypothetical protein DDW23_08615 [Planctomycetes bacterium]|nr:hypothetical protein [Planctomycetota bacterium]
MEGQDAKKKKTEEAFQKWLSLLKGGDTPETIQFLADQDVDVRAGLEEMLGQYKNLVKETKAANIEGGGHVEIADAPSGEKILGDFRLLRELGRGGVGVVWEAEQVSLGRRVALKLLAPHFGNNPLFIERFQMEAEVGSQISHSSVIQTLSVGEASGTHFIAQELVSGGKNLADEISFLRGKSELGENRYREVAEFFRKVAEGLAAAHGLDVVHRDLKPSNILLTDAGDPKVADFGLAKIKDELDFEDSDTEQIVGTPYYMSPEQAASSKIGVDHRTDIFSLGATLYEALTFQRAFEGDTGPQVLERILMEDPPDPDDVRAGIPSELSLICMKALEKNRKRRYQTMADFGADLERFLKDEPIKARKPGLHIRAAKWSRRHPVLSVSGSIAVASFCVISWLLAGNVSARVAAETAKQKAAGAAAVAVEGKEKREEVVDFLVGLFQSEKETVSAEEVLERGERRLKESLAEQPVLRARLLRTLGEVHKNLGRYETSEPFLKEALVILEEHLAPKSEDALDCLHSLGALMIDLDKISEGRAFLERSVAGKLEVLGEESPSTLFTQSILADALRKNLKWAEAEALGRQTLERQRRVLGLVDEDTIGTMLGLAETLVKRERVNEAEDLVRQSLGELKSLVGLDHPLALLASHNLGSILYSQQRLDIARDVFIETLEGRRRIYPPDHSYVTTTANNLAAVHFGLGEYGKAESIWRERLPSLRKMFSDSHQMVVVCRVNLSWAALMAGRFVEAEKEFRALAEEFTAEEFPEYHINAVEGLARVAAVKKDWLRVEALFRQTIPLREDHLGGPQHSQVARASLADALFMQKKLHEAEDIARKLVGETASSDPYLESRQALLKKIRQALNSEKMQ